MKRAKDGQHIIGYRFVDNKLAMLLPTVGIIMSDAEITEIMATHRTTLPPTLALHQRKDAVRQGRRGEGLRTQSYPIREKEKSKEEGDK